MTKLLQKIIFQFLSRTIYSTTLIIFISLQCQTTAYAQSEESETPIEEIVIKAQRPLKELKREAKEADNFKYELFNSLRETDDFEITCVQAQSNQTRIRRRTCDVGYMKDAREEDAERFRDHGSIGRKENQIVVQLAGRTRDLNSEMLELALEHPELAEAIILADRSQRVYEKARKENFKGTFLGKLFSRKSKNEE